MEILSISKTDKRSIYSVSKKQAFWKKARELINKLGYKGIVADIFGKSRDNPNSADKKISTIKDRGEGFEINKNLQVDFIFGDKKIFIILTYKKDLQKKVSKIIFTVFKS